MAELAAVYLGIRGIRRFVLYVSATQDQADFHVQAIANYLERLGVDRRVGKYGQSKGWRRNQLQASNGFNVAAFGLDIGGRGVRIDSFRPDLIILDDIDSQNDSPRAVKKKEGTVASAVLGSGSTNSATLFAQNLIHDESIAARIEDGRSSLFANRESTEVVPAIYGLKTEPVVLENGRRSHRIIAGTPSWEYQSLEVCQSWIYEEGLGTFLRERQHEVYATEGIFFNVDRFNYIDELPKDLTLRFARCWDFAATEGGGDYTVGVLLAADRFDNIYILDVIRGQWGTDKVKKILYRTAQRDYAGELWSSDEYEFNQLAKPGALIANFSHLLAPNGRVITHFPQDPGAAGKYQTSELLALLKEFNAPPYTVRSTPVTGRKSIRARGLQGSVNDGNVYLLRAEWNLPFKSEYRRFREDDTHEHDDQVDPAADGHRILVKPKKDRTLTIY